MDRYDNYYSVDLFGESIEGHRHINPYDEEMTGTTIINNHVEEDRRILSNAPTIEGFDDDNFDD